VFLLQKKVVGKIYKSGCGKLKTDYLLGEIKFDKKLL
jgi:hypothetical protein